jgi:ribA/ribD-fused uncharacterized protein
MKTKPIERFDGRYRFLSNFQAVTVEFDGGIYASVEHAYQAAKTESEDHRAHFRSGITPGAAKRYGRAVPLRSDLTEVRLDVMLELLRKKFANRGLRDLLLSTEDAELIEWNEWGDTFWGVCRGIGDNHLGRLLMQVRSEIRSGGH